MYMAKIQEASPDAVDSGPIFDTEQEQKVQNDDHYDVFAIKCQHPEQSESVHETYLIEQDAHNVIIESVDMNSDSEQIDQNDEDVDLAKEHELLASLIKKLICEIDESKNRNKFLETSNKVLIDKLKSEIKDFKNKNNSLELSNNQFKEANNKLSEENDLLYANFKKSQAELKRRDSFKYASEMEIECAKVREMKNKLSAHQDTISILKQQKDAQIKLYKTREDQELEKVIELENKVKDDQDPQSMEVDKHTLLPQYQPLHQHSHDQNKQYPPSLAFLEDKKHLELVEIVLFIVDSGCSKHMTGNLKLLINYVEKFLGTVKSGNDQIAPILGYGDLGNDLLSGSRGTDLYSITLQDTNSPNPLCLVAKATLSQAWLWHRRLSHLNFDTINLLSKNDIVVGLPMLKLVKDHLCSSCELGKAKRKSFHTKLTPSSKRRLQLLLMDLCGPMRVASINGKRYVLVIVDDYSRYIWTRFLRSKDETPKVLIDFLRLVQRGLQAQVGVVRTDKGTEFLNQTLHAYFGAERIQHQTSVARTPEQNGVVERRNRTLVEAARTMLSAVPNRKCKPKSSVKFGNDQIAPILGYGDLVQGLATIKRVYYVEGLNHNLFSVGQFCDADLEVAFRKSTCYIHDLKGTDLLTGSRGTYLYSITLQDNFSPNPICLMAKATL
nr:hypothetical protein [Tanacetum cinerariifolium]